MIDSVGVLGGGAWGTALAILLAGRPGDFYSVEKTACAKAQNLAVRAFNAGGDKLRSSVVQRVGGI